MVAGSNPAGGAVISARLKNIFFSRDLAEYLPTNHISSHERLRNSGVKNIRVSIVVSISACHADDPGSIPGRGTFLNPFAMII